MRSGGSQQGVASCVLTPIDDQLFDLDAIREWLAKRIDQTIANQATELGGKTLLEPKPVITHSRAIVLRNQGPTGKFCPIGHEFCCICGHTAPSEEFHKNDSCPNPGCPKPDEWSIPF